MLFSNTYIVQPGYSFADSVVAIVIGRSGTGPMEQSGHSNLFISPMTTLVDDDGESIATDFSRDTYLQLVKIFTVPSDWVLNLSISSGECTFEMNMLKFQLLC